MVAVAISVVRTQGRAVHRLKSGLRSIAFRGGMHVALHLRSPFQKSPEIRAFMPQELPEFDEPDLLHFYAAVGLDSPQ